MKLRHILYTVLLLPSLSVAGNIDYCKNTQATQQEDAVIQRLVMKFGVDMGCEVGDNCLLKWDVHGNHEKFSIAWKKQCGPVINGMYQLGDEGHGSTFVCRLKANKSVCCWPLGYERLKNYHVCSDNVMKNPNAG